MNQKGFANIILVVVIVVLAGTAGYFALTSKQGPATQRALTPPAGAPTTTIVDGTTNWKKYKVGGSYGFEFKYPPSFSLMDVSKTRMPYIIEESAFELIDNQRGCYIGPPKEVGLEGTNPQIQNISTLNGLIRVAYYTIEGKPTLVLPDFSNIRTPQLKAATRSSSAEASLNLMASGDPLILYRQNISYFSNTLHSTCVTDFEKILSTFGFVK